MLCLCDAKAINLATVRTQRTPNRYRLTPVFSIVKWEGNQVNGMITRIRCKVAPTVPDTCLINVSIRLTSTPLLLHLQMFPHENGIESEGQKVLGVWYLLTMGIGLSHTVGSRQ